MTVNTKISCTTIQISIKVPSLSYTQMKRSSRTHPLSSIFSHCSQAKIYSFFIYTHFIYTFHLTLRPLLTLLIITYRRFPEVTVDYVNEKSRSH